jgi:hypothetical protein
MPAALARCSSLLFSDWLSSLLKKSPFEEGFAGLQFRDKTVQVGPAFMHSPSVLWKFLPMLVLEKRGDLVSQILLSERSYDEPCIARTPDRPERCRIR